MSVELDTTAIILAAGGSSRMGRPKALLEIDGQTLLERAVDTARAAGAEPLVVLGGDAERIRPHTAGARTIINDDWSKGMGTSLAWGMTVLGDDVERVLVLAVDQPAVDAALLERLAAACDDTVDAAATRYDDGVLGVPACFGPALFDTLRTLDGDQGARALLRSDAYRVAEVPSDGAAVDVDTPEQWRAFVAAQANGGRA